jgi:hypothetical protein
MLTYSAVLSSENAYPLSGKEDQGLHIYHSPPSKILFMGSKLPKGLYKYYANQAASYGQK